ncbi:MAG: beta-ketoacyl-[acyl-carrier-protein] synthase family protein [bacterium]
MNHRVIVSGMGLITSLGVGVEENWSNIQAGKSGLVQISNHEIPEDAGFCGGLISDVPACLLKDVSRRMDISSILLLIAAQEAFSQAGLLEDQIEKGYLILGTSLGGIRCGEKYNKKILYEGTKRARPSWLLDYLAFNQGIHLAERFFDHAKVLTVSNACASGTNAIGYGYQLIKYGRAGFVAAGGYDVLSPYVLGGFNSLRLLTREKCRPFDKQRDGLLLGEGAGIMILESEENFIKRGGEAFSGEIIGYGESNDTFHITQPDPSGKGAAAAMSKAVEDAGLKPSQIQYINAHGTGTLINDKMEATAINNFFGESAIDIPVSSVKPMIGHLLGGAGAVEAIITLLALQHRTLPVNLNYDNPDPDCQLYVVTENSLWKDIRIGMSNSFGFGGMNASIVLKSIEKKGT